MPDVAMLSGRCGIPGHDYTQQTFTQIFLFLVDKSQFGAHGNRPSTPQARLKYHKSITAIRYITENGTAGRRSWAISWLTISAELCYQMRQLWWQTVDICVCDCVIHYLHKRTQQQQRIPACGSVDFFSRPWLFSRLVLLINTQQSHLFLPWNLWYVKMSKIIVLPARHGGGGWS